MLDFSLSLKSYKEENQQTKPGCFCWRLLLSMLILFSFSYFSFLKLKLAGLFVVPVLECTLFFFYLHKESFLKAQVRVFLVSADFKAGIFS